MANAYSLTLLLLLLYDFYLFVRVQGDTEKITRTINAAASIVLVLMTYLFFEGKNQIFVYHHHPQ